MLQNLRISKIASPVIGIRAWREALSGALLSGRVADAVSTQEVQKLINLVGLAIVLVPVFVTYYALVGFPALAIALSSSGIIMVLSLLVYRCSGNLALARDIFLVSLFGFLIYASLYFGTTVSPVTFWLAAIPVVGILLGNGRAGAGWLALVLAFLSALAGLTYGSIPEFPVSWPEHLYSASLAAMIVAIFLFVLMIDAGRRRSLFALEEANAVVTELARRDSLTGLYNRRYVWEALEREERQARAAGVSFAILLVDIDRFKTINDSFGHVTGDIVLKDVASAIEAITGGTHFCGRYGGEEFLVLLRGEQSSPLQCAELIRSTVAALSFAHVNGPQVVTVSIGVAGFEARETFTDTFRRADEALYSAKHSGRNCVVQVAPKSPVASAA